jgi:ABC-type transport system involved in Fe-S cluster assembly fused permease/ATPase subunit
MGLEQQTIKIGLCNIVFVLQPPTLGNIELVGKDIGKVLQSSARRAVC